MKEFMVKVQQIQTDLKAPKGQYNNFGKYNYRSCEDIVEAVKPLLATHSLVLQLSDEMIAVGNRVYVKATARLTDGVNVIESYGNAREAETKKGMDDSQITGAASSYARKCALNGLLGIDDTKDADATNNHGKSEPMPIYTAEQFSKYHQYLSDDHTAIEFVGYIRSLPEEARVALHNSFTADKVKMKRLASSKEAEGTTTLIDIVGSMSQEQVESSNEFTDIEKRLINNFRKVK